VARLEAIKLLFIFGCYKNLRLFQLDIKSGFLNIFIQEEVYVEQPLGFENPRKSNSIYRLKKALNGLKQTPRAWYERLSKFLIHNSFDKGKVDNYFVHRERRNRFLTSTYLCG